MRLRSIELLDICENMFPRPHFDRGVTKCLEIRVGNAESWSSIQILTTIWSRGIVMAEQ